MNSTLYDQVSIQAYCGTLTSGRGSFISSGLVTGVTRPLLCCSVDSALLPTSVQHTHQNKEKAHQHAGKLALRTPEVRVSDTSSLAPLSWAEPGNEARVHHESSESQ